MSSSEDDRKLIQIVEYHQVLWDNRIKGFRDKKLTQHAWASVAELLERDVADVMQRWASLRKQYSRKISQLRQKTGQESPERQWHLLSLLSFLRPCIAPRKVQSNTQQSNYTSTEDVSSSSMSDGSSEVPPLLIHLNPVEKTSREPYEIPEKKTKVSKSFPTTPANHSIKKPFRPIAAKPKEQKASPVQCLPSVTKSTNTFSGSRTQYKEQSDDSLSGMPPKVPRLDSNVPKSSTSVTKSQCAEVKPVLRPPEAKIKKLKTSADNGSLSASKSTNDHSEFLRSKSYDADDYFLLSLAPDLRRLTARQKYEAKVKMLEIVNEQYLKS